MACCREARHVGADLADDILRAAVLDAGDRAQQLNTCSDYAIATTDATDAFSIDAATPAFPIPDSEATVTPAPEDTVTPSDRCVPARNMLSKKQKQVKKLRAQRRSTQKRKRKIALTKQIAKTRRGIAKTRRVIERQC